MKEPKEKALKVICILFIITGSLSFIFSVIQLFMAGYMTAQVGISHTFVSIITAVINILYSLSVMLVAIWAIQRKHLNACFNIGVLLTLWSIINIFIVCSNAFIHKDMSIAAIVSGIIDIVMALLFTLGIDRLIKFRKNNQALPETEVNDAKVQDSTAEGK